MVSRSGGVVRPPAGEVVARAGADVGEHQLPRHLELDNGDVVVIGQDLTGSYEGRLPAGVSVDPGERLIVIPRATLLAAKPDIPDA